MQSKVVYSINTSILFVVIITSIFLVVPSVTTSSRSRREVDPRVLSYSISPSSSHALPSSVPFSQVAPSPESISLITTPSQTSTVTKRPPTPVTTETIEENKCEIARTRCAYRMGCGLALQSYMINCADLIANRTDICSVNCQTSLIALMSTDEGQDLMDCDCDGSSFCLLNKERIQVCRAEVLRASADDAVVSCHTARAICMADLPCSTALTYYYNRCRGLFQHISKRKCTKLCKNSLDILNRQEKAAKLKTCYCEGSEDFDCQTIKESTEQLCQDDQRNSLDPIPSSTCSTSSSRTCIILSTLALITTQLLLLQSFDSRKIRCS